MVDLDAALADLTQLIEDLTRLRAGIQDMHSALDVVYLQSVARGLKTEQYITDRQEYCPDALSEELDYIWNKFKGSWKWIKTDGEMTYFNTAGDIIGTYLIIDVPDFVEERRV